jgi:hypothetical protein
MKTAVTLMRTLDERNDIPEHILQPLSAIFDGNPRVSINTLTWQYDANETVAENTRGEVPALIVTLKGQLNGFGNDYRAALAAMDKLEHDFAAQGYIVSITAKPLDISASGSIGDRRESDGQPLEFGMRLSWRPRT